MQQTPISGPHAPLPDRLRPLTPRQQRERLESALERLLGAVDAIIEDLDALDGEPDFEPSCGATELMTNQHVAWQTNRMPTRGSGRKLIDLEDVEYDCREPEEHDEPSLGSQEGGAGGTTWNPTQTFIIDGEVDAGDEPEALATEDQS